MKPGKVLYEMEGVPESEAREALRVERSPAARQVVRAVADMRPAVVAVGQDTIELVAPGGTVLGRPDGSIPGHDESLRVAVPEREDARLAGVGIDGEDLAVADIRIAGVAGQKAFITKHGVGI